MAEPYDILASLNRMLESEERREQTRLQSSLALMQFAQQKRLQDIQLAGQQLELLQAANSQMMGSQSESFLIESGLDALYLQTIDEDEPEEGVTSMANQLTKGDWNLSPEEAHRVVGAVYAAKAGNHQGVLRIVVIYTQQYNLEKWLITLKKVYLVNLQKLLLVLMKIGCLQ